jgi:hypothetical protein
MKKLESPELKPHPLALNFPRLSSNDQDDLKESIKTVGLLHSLVVNSKYEILDGVGRWMACMELEKEGTETNIYNKLHMFEIVHPGISEAQFIYEVNMYRRHLTDDQRIAIATTMFLPQWRQEGKLAKEASPAKARAVKASKNNETPVVLVRAPQKTHERIAMTAKVGKTKARKAIELAEKKPELLAKVASGEKKLAAAYHEYKETSAPKPETKPEAANVKQLKVLPERVQKKVDGWCDHQISKLLEKSAPDEQEVTLRIIADYCYAAMERFSK